MLRRQFLLGAAGALACGAARPAFGQTWPATAPAAPPPLAPPGPALPDTIDAYRAVFDAWAAEYRPDTAILVVKRQGKTVVKGGYRSDPEGPSLIASMSKAITAVAIATLVRDGRLTFTTPMREALAGFFRRYGPPADRRFEDVTVEQLLVHRSGLLGNPDGDPSHKMRLARAKRGEGHLDVSPAVLAEHLRYRLVREPGTQASYSNAGYMALAVIIEQVTGRPYEAYCGETIFAQLGIRSARLHPDWRVYGGSGGWIITGEDYLQFYEVFDPAHPFLGDAAKAWIDQMQTRWDAGNHGRWYSLGVNTSAARGRWRVEHSGKLHSRARDARGRPTAAIIRSYGCRMPNGTAVFLAIKPADAVEKPGLLELRNEIERTHAVVTRVT